MGAEHTRPWWASDDPGVDELAVDEDPLTAHRTARRPAPQASGADPAADHDAPGADRAHAPGADRAHDASTCGLCPVCLGLRLLGEHRPEVLEHLNEASRHLSAAIRGLLEQDTQASRADRSQRPPSDRFERIQVDGPDARDGAARSADGAAEGEPGAWRP